MVTFFKMLVLLTLTSSVYADEKKIADLYELNHINGSLQIESDNGKVIYQYNVNDGEQFVPASTFKIPNTLIILQEDLIKNQNEVIKWDGKKRAYAPWNQDQTLKSAFQVSCVWCYQRYALKVGDKKYRSYLRTFNYGNHLTGDDITRFWLDGELKVSVKDQINFMRKVYSEDLPIHKEHIKTLKNIMLSEVHDAYQVWSKTGWSGKDGWYVGYLAINNQTWFFANHMEIREKSDLALRKKITMDAFRALNIVK